MAEDPVVAKKTAETIGGSGLVAAQHCHFKQPTARPNSAIRSGRIILAASTVSARRDAVW
jgi:hypothetical protein